MDKILRKEADIRKLLEDETRVKRASELVALMKAHKEYNRRISKEPPNRPRSKSDEYRNVNVFQAPTIDDMMRTFQDTRRPQQIQQKDKGLKRLGLNERMSTSSFSLDEKEPPNKTQAEVVQAVLSWRKKSKAYVKTAMTEEENLENRTSHEELVSESANSAKPRVKLVNPKTITNRKRRASRKTIRSRKQRAKRIMTSTSPTNRTLSPTISDLESLNKLIEENKRKILYVERQLHSINQPIIPPAPARPPKTATVGLIKKTNELRVATTTRSKSKSRWDANCQPIPQPRPAHLSRPNKRESDGRLPRPRVRKLERTINDPELLTLKPPPLSPKPSIGNQTSKNTIAWFKLNPHKSSGEKINTPKPRSSRRPTAKEAIENSERIRLGLQARVKPTRTTKRVQGVLNIPREVQGSSPKEVKSTQIPSKSGIFRTLFRRSGRVSNSDAMDSNESNAKKGIFQRFWQGMKSILWKENRVTPMTQND